jgi:hypothetical protein
MRDIPETQLGLFRLSRISCRGSLVGLALATIRGIAINGSKGLRFRSWLRDSKGIKHK